ncbi:MAG: hypothetical protein J5884_00465 [Paludibacteraceae bacterium]|nr:hypothetical protein [Paludibacteraceae bacterium]
MNKEMNFYDMCLACWHAICRGCASLGRMFAQMLRLTYRYWWLVISVVILALGAAFYYTRLDNLTYKVQAVALLNGPTIHQFDQVYVLLKSGNLIDPKAEIIPYIEERKVREFETYRVIDCKHDGVADYIDFKNRSSNTDTLKVQMNDRLCLEFRMKKRDLDALPYVEKALLDYFNSSKVLQQAYEPYMANLHEEVDFNHRQFQKLDSLTSCYYFQSANNTFPTMFTSNGIAFYGERKIRLFLDQIYQQHAHVQQHDHRLQLATAPVTLENHFSVYPKPVNDRKKCFVLFFLLGWFGACALAEIIDKRRAIIAWLKQ